MKLTVPNGYAPPPAPVTTWDDDRCDHAGAELRRLIQADGRTVAVRQCLKCGANCGAVKKGGIAVHELKEFDRSIRDDYSAKRTAAWEQQRLDRQREFDAWYAAYLRSPKWYHIRERVLQRDKYMCQGCHIKRATQVHHLTYERVGRELMFDLASICDDCHGVAHPDKV